MNPDSFIEILAPTGGDRILDIGAGKGVLADLVMKASRGAEVYAVEPNEKRVESMKREFPAIRSSVGSAEDLPFPDSYFDKAYTTMALHHFSDLDKALLQVARVLRQGGTFVILELEPDSGEGRLFRFLAKLVGERLNLMTRDQLRAKLEAAGSFKVARVEGHGSRYLIQLTRA